MAFPRLAVPDLDGMEGFLLDFGMVRAFRTPDILYMRGRGSAPYVHVIHRGEPAFLGFAFEAASRADLDTIAARDGFGPVEALDAPGGGWRTQGLDPEGLQIEVVFGIEPDPVHGDVELRPLNMGSTFQRLGQTQRITSGPSRIKRFGHLAMNVRDVPATLAWYQSHFGLLASDQINLAPGMPVAVFTRCDRGSEPADHHSILFTSSMASGGVSGLNHLSWEVCDIDDVHVGSDHLAVKGRVHEWGIGRHLLGSQVFDYWRDPWGQIHEHWTDGDQFDASVPVGEHTIEVAAASQWGPNMPATFGRTIPTPPL
jgi:catechol 2,3-dioxygenase-like lactoylglutathione lyase family enzyme